MLKNVLQICAFVGVLSSYKKAAALPNSEEQVPPLKWAVDVLQDKVSVSSLKDIEPGFDLTEEEMNKFKIWRQGIVPYYIDELSFDKVLRDRIRTFLDFTGSLTGLHFMEMTSPPKNPDTRWVFFVNRKGLLECADHSPMNFTNVGVQKVLLGYDCLTNHAELAEVVLVLAGVPHQHNAPDRDKYVKINFDKIIPDKRYLFEKLEDADWLYHDLEYDFSSAGHYHFHKHTIDGTATINPKVPVERFVGEGDGYSYTDILKVRMLYNYLTKNKNRSAKAPECKKLFKLGSKFKQTQPSYKEEIQPRKKPDKYLGLAEGSNGASEDGSPSGLAGNDIQPRGDAVENFENDDPVGTQGNFDQMNNTNTDDQEVDGDKVSLKKKGAMKLDPLTFMSDYETDVDKKNKRKGSQSLKLRERYDKTKRRNKK